MGIMVKMETQTAKKTSVWLPSKATAAIITTIKAPRMEPAQVKVHDESLFYRGDTKTKSVLILITV